MESILERAINESGVGVIICSPDGTIISANRNACALLGCDGDAAGAEGGHIRSLSPEIAALEPRWNDGQILRDHSLRLAMTDGPRWLSVDACSEPLNGAPVQVIIIRDVTGVRQCEQRLLASERTLTSIIESIPDIVYRIDPSGTITFINEEIRRYGYRVDELVGKPIFDIVHPNDRDRALWRINDRRTGERRTRSFEVRIITKGQETISFEGRDNDIYGTEAMLVNAEGLYISGDEGRIFLGTQGILRNISDRKRIEYERLRNEEKWRTIMESLEDGYYEVDLNGSFTYVNKALCEVTEADYNDIIGKKYDVFFGSDDAASIGKMFNEVYKTGAPAKLRDWTGITVKGRRKKIEGSISLIRDIDGNVAGFRGIIRDVTDRVIMERELIQARKLEAIGILAGGIAHDYNNALTAILGNLTLAKMEIDPANKELVEIIDDAESASLKVMELTKRLSFFAKGGKPSRKVTDVGPLVKDTADAVLSRWRGTYRVEIAEGLWQVEIDEFQISQVISHILHNAVESMPQPKTITIGVKNIVIEQEESHHEITLQPDRYVVVSIRDEGIGIKEEDYKNIFDPYFTTKDIASGMGLAISYAIIKRHHGYIDLLSREGEGTTFFVYLPVADR